MMTSKLASSQIALLDVDGCLIDSAHRFAKWDESTPDSHDYWRDWRKDTVIPAGRAVYLGLYLAGVHPVFVTARPYEKKDLTHRQITEALPEIGTNYTLYLRDQELTALAIDPSGRRHYLDGLLKSIMLDRHLQHTHRKLSDVVIGIDDNVGVINTYRERGIIAYQTAKGWS